MLAREIIEDSVIPILARQDPNLEFASETISQKVKYNCILIFFMEEFRF